MGDLLSFPVELLQQISGLLLNPDQKALGGTCQILRSLVAPEIFRQLTIDFYSARRVRHQLQTLANSQSTAHSFAGLFTKHLELKIYSLEPPAVEEDQPRTYSLWQVQRTWEIEELRGNFGPAIIALKRCESLKVSTGSRGYNNRIPPWLTDILSVAIASISTLNKIEFSYQWGPPPPPIVAANIVLGLQRDVVSPGLARVGGADCTPEFIAALFSSIDTAISGNPGLQINTGLHGYNQQTAPTMGQLLGNPSMSSSQPLHLFSLDLAGPVGEDALSATLPPLPSLRTLSLGPRILGSVDLIWDILSEASIFLKYLSTRHASTPALFRYLSSYQGLEGVSLSLPVVFSMRSGRFWDTLRLRDSMRLRDVLNFLGGHKASLKRLDVACDHWAYSVGDAAALLQLAALENLSISVEASVLPQLMDVVFSLPYLVVLCLNSTAGGWDSGRGAILEKQSMDDQMGWWIGECVIPTATGSKIEDVRIAGGRRFRRRGDRFRFGTVEPDGKWREIGKDEVLDQRGWVVKRSPPRPPGG